MSTGELEQRVTRITVVPVGQPLYSERAYQIEIEDEPAGSEYLTVSDQTDTPGKLAIDPIDWPMLRQTIDRMIGECRS